MMKGTGVYNYGAATEKIRPQSSNISRTTELLLNKKNLLNKGQVISHKKSAQNPHVAYSQSSKILDEYITSPSKIIDTKQDAESSFSSVKREVVVSKVEL